MNSSREGLIGWRSCPEGWRLAFFGAGPPGALGSNIAGLGERVRLFGREVSLRFLYLFLLFPFEGQEGTG